jgi:F-type H+-transporting ATPase subunit b
MNPHVLASAFGHARLLSAAGGVEVDINPYLVLLQLALVTGLMLVLKPILFDPLLSLFEERERRVEGARQAAHGMDDKAADILRRLESERDRVHREAAAERDKRRAEAQRIEAQEMAEAKREVGEVLDKGRARLQAEATTLGAELGEQTGGIARDIAGRVLGREVS